MELVESETMASTGPRRPTGHPDDAWRSIDGGSTTLIWPTILSSSRYLLSTGWSRRPAPPGSSASGCSRPTIASSDSIRPTRSRSRLNRQDWRTAAELQQRDTLAELVGRPLNRTSVHAFDLMAVGGTRMTASTRSVRCACATTCRHRRTRHCVRRRIARRLPRATIRLGRGARLQLRRARRRCSGGSALRDGRRRVRNARRLATR